MKYLVVIVLYCLTSLFGFSQQANFTIKGRINKDSKAETLYVQGSFINIEIPITAEREFFYKGTLVHPEECFIKTDNSFAWSLWVTNGEIDVTLQEWELDPPDTSGKKFLKISALSAPAETEKSQWFKEQQSLISRGFGKLSFAQFRDSMSKYFDPLLEDYILEHPHSKFSAHITGLAYNKDNAKKLLSLVDREISLEERLRFETARKRDSATKKGLTIADFKMKTIKGKVFSSKNLSSNYTLLEFWSHDCYPCRKQNPDLLKVYSKFRSKGFEIVGISLDKSKAEWQKAVTSDKVPWIHVSDLKGWDNLLVKRYFVDYIPFNILIDKNKKIIATHLSPDHLQQKLTELLNN